MVIKAGDYLITKENHLFRIMEAHLSDLGDCYDIQSLETESNYGCLILRAVPSNVLAHMGKIIPEEQITKTVKLLYG